MVEVLFRGGRLGDTLFEYAFSRIIAEHFNYSLITSNINQEYVKELQLIFPVGKLVEKPIQVIDGSVSYNNTLLDEILNNRTDRKLYITGFFHMYEYYKNYKDKIKSWFKFPKKRTLIQQSVGVHIRNSDWPDKWRHPIDYYIDILKQEAPEKIYITSDEPEHTSVKTILKEFKQAELYNESPFNTIGDFQQLDTLILSEGGFSFWMGWLSDAKKIYASNLSYTPNLIEMKVYDESRYIYN